MGSTHTNSSSPALDASLAREHLAATEGIWLWTWDALTDELSVRPCKGSPEEGGNAEASLVGHWRERLDDADRGRVVLAMRQALRDGSEMHTELRARANDGRWHRWLARGRASSDPSCLVGSLVDLTPRSGDGMPIEAPLHPITSIDGLAAVLEQTPAVFFVKDRLGRYLFANRRLLEIFQSDRSAVLGKKASELFPPTVAEILERNDARVWEGQTLHVEETILEGGRLRTFLCVKVPLISHDGTIDRLCCIATDITERKVAEQALSHELAELGRSNDELLDFAIGASHDLKEPLRLVLTSLRQLERGTSDAAAWIERAVRGVEQMGVLIEELMVYARAGSQGARFAQVDCQRVVQDVLAVLRVPIEEAQAIIAIEALPVVWGDEVLIGQLFQNLLANAIKFRNGPPTITVQASPAGTFWRFRVQDNGIGIDPRYFIEIFEPFRRLHTRQQYPGSGIGLAICRKIVERHGGEITVESTPGRGSSFVFALPQVPHAD